MTILKDRLTKLEKHLQTLIEGSAARLFPSGDLFDDLSHSLIQSMQAEVITQADGRIVAPNEFTLAMHPTELRKLSEKASLRAELAGVILEAGNKAGVTFLDPPVVCFEDSPQVPPGEVVVSARIHLQDVAKTAGMDPQFLPDRSAMPINSFFIVDGTHLFPLIEPVINIGRRPDNHLVIKDGRVSRVHAQLRAIKGHYVIFDLGTKGGTLVNDQPVRESTLYPGDVVSLAGVPLIFGQDESEIGETQQHISSPEEPK